MGVVSRFMHFPQIPHIHHMESVMRIIRYLERTSGRGILFKKNNHLDLLAYTVADWTDD